MNSSRTPKIIVGVGLVAAYAAGLTALTLSSVQDSNAKANTPVVAAPVVAEPSATSEAAVAATDTGIAAPEPVAAVAPAQAAMVSGAGPAASRSLRSSTPSEPVPHQAPTVTSTPESATNGPALAEADASAVAEQDLPEPEADSASSIELDAQLTPDDLEQSEDDTPVQ